MRSVYRLLLVSVFAVLAGCGGTTPPSTYYVLDGASPMVMGEAPLENITIGVGPVLLPDHLDRPQIVTRSSQHRINMNEFHRWGGSLERQFAETLMGNLSALLQTPRVTLYPWERALRPQYQVYVTVRRFAGVSGKGSNLDAVWQLVDVDTDDSKLTRRFVTFVPARGNGVEAYVKAQSAALEALSRDIAEGVYEVAQQ